MRAGREPVPIGCAMVPSEMFIATAAPVPIPEGVKMPGELLAMATSIAIEAVPPRVTTTGAMRVVCPNSNTDHGTCTLICRGETYRTAAGMPANVTDTPPSIVGQGRAAAAAGAMARLSPKIEAMDPGARAGLAVRLSEAPLTMPAAAIVGGGVAVCATAKAAETAKRDMW